MSKINRGASPFRTPNRSKSPMNLNVFQQTTTKNPPIQFQKSFQPFQDLSNLESFNRPNLNFEKNSPFKDQQGNVQDLQKPKSKRRQPIHHSNYEEQIPQNILNRRKLSKSSPQKEQESICLDNMNIENKRGLKDSNKFKELYSQIKMRITIENLFPMISVASIVNFVITAALYEVRVFPSIFLVLFMYFKLQIIDQTFAILKNNSGTSFWISRIVCGWRRFAKQMIQQVILLTFMYFAVDNGQISAASISTVVLCYVSIQLPQFNSKQEDPHIMKKTIRKEWNLQNLHQFWKVVLIQYVTSIITFIGLTLILYVISILGAKSFECILYVIEGLKIYLKNSMIYVLNKWIKQFNSLTFNILTINQEIEEYEFQQPSVQIMSISLETLEIQFFIGSYIFIIELIAKYISDMAKSNTLRKLCIAKIVNNKDKMMILMKNQPTDYNATNRQSKVFPDDFEVERIHAKLLIFKYLGNQKEETVRKVLSQSLLTNIEEDFVKLAIQIQKLEQFDLSSLYQFSFRSFKTGLKNSENPWRFFYQEVCYNLSQKQHQKKYELLVMMDNLMMLSQLFVYESKFLNKLGELPDNIQITLVRNLQRKTQTYLDDFDKKQQWTQLFDYKVFQQIKERL